jgi:ABC-type lipoprotein release transport system permease subunit
MRSVRHLLPILGVRPALTFGGVTFLVAALLATVNLTSRYALKLYVEDQLRRIRWDLAVYQKGAPGATIDRLPDALRHVPSVRQVETLAFLRAEFPPDGEVVSRVDGQQLAIPWVSLLAATDLSILPPQLALALTGGDAGADPRGAWTPGAGTAVDPNGAVLALVGPEREIGRSFLDLQGARQFSVDVMLGASERRLFDATVKKAIRLERDELNRWVMDQTGSVTYIPHIGLIVVMPFRTDALQRFDSVAAGLVPKTMLGPDDADYGHVHEAEYEPEVAYLARLDRAQLISGWDISGSLARVMDANHRIEDAAFEAVRSDLRVPHHSTRWQPAVPLPTGARIALAHDPADADAEDRRSFAAKFIVDSTTEVLLMRMERLARLVGLVTVLVALPLLWVAWLLAASLAGLLMLNERRTLGLMRLRGIPGRDIGRALLIAIVAGGLVGGLLGLVAGSLVPLALYEGGRLPIEVLTSPFQVAMALMLLAISVLLSFVVSRRLVRYAMTISPLEASRRVATSEAGRTGIRFGFSQALALVVGSVVLAGWIAGADLAELLGLGETPLALRLVDFAGLPLFVYGIAALLASRRRWLEPVIHPFTRLAGGALGRVAQGHIAAKPHRTLAFLLIVALMASVSLYPTITSGSFEDKAIRGARVQLGADWQFLFNAPDLVDVSLLQGGVRQQLEALRPSIDRITARVADVPGVLHVTYMVEAVLPNFYLPDYGLRGVPAYLLGDITAYERTVYVEPQVGLDAPFAALAAKLRAGDVVVSPPVARFKKLEPGKTVRLGVTTARKSVTSVSAGTLAFLPGLPPRTVTDRQGYVQARIDYLNHLFSENAYVVAAADNPKLADLRVLVPRVIVLASGDGTVAPEDLQPRIAAALPLPPLEAHNVSEEVGKVATDMYISLALANMRIYLVGGILLALIAIVSVAGANYVEDRRTLALLRIRGSSPAQLWRFILALLVSPALVGLVVGALVAVVAGYGLANYVWELREIRTVVQLLPTRLVLSPLWGSVAALLMVLLVAVASLFSAWVYRRTAHRSLQGA